MEIKKLNLDVYDDEIAEMYNKVIEAGYHPQKKYIAGLLNIIPEGGSVLELGCGTGNTLIPLQEKGRICYGIDKSSSMLYKLKARNANITTFLGDVRDTNFLGTYDYIISCNGVFSIKEGELESYLLDESDVINCLKKYSETSKSGILVSRGTAKKSLKLHLNSQEYVHREIREGDMMVMIHLLFENKDFKGVKMHVKRRYPLQDILEEANTEDFKMFKLIKF